METAYGTINQVLVTLFNDIMRIEERALIEPGLSIREVHVIEAVCEAQESGLSTMTDLAARLRITPGSLSVAVGTLVRKGYLHRVHDMADKRVNRMAATEAAVLVNKKHQDFHRQMTDSVIGHLNAEELAALVHALGSINQYFQERGS
ncbi:MAG: MarR family winged helix-turn-helix transcriptional regulator [Clostridia bacterium]